MERLALPYAAEATRLYYWPVETDFVARLRAFAADRLMGLWVMIDNLYSRLPECGLIDSIHAAITDVLTDLWTEWWSHSADEIEATLNGEMPLEHTSPWVLSRLQMDSAYWFCGRCQQGFLMRQTIGGSCPNCYGNEYAGGLYLR